MWFRSKVRGCGHIFLQIHVTLVVNIYCAILKPADDNIDKIYFDMQMNVRRVFVENIFGLLKGRWRILKRASCYVFRLPKVVAACCVLHNFCQLMEVGDYCDHYYKIMTKLTNNE